MRRRAAFIAVAAAALGSPGRAAAQGFGPGGFGSGSGFGGPSSAPSQQQQPKPGNMPETHAASGATDSVVPAGNEPSLPERPLMMKRSVAERIGSDMMPGELELGRTGETVRKPYGLYYEETSGDYRFRTLFPFWLERTEPSLEDPSVTDRASLYGGLYYNRRSAGHADDIVFPLFWNLRTPESRTTVVGPFVNRVAPGERDDWLAPLYFTGGRETGSYEIIPPLLTYLNNVGDGGFNLIGPAFCSWEGSEHCDTRSAREIDLGVAPLYFYGKDETSSYELITPLLHYHDEDEKDLSWTDVWGPYYRRHTEDLDMLHFMPLYWSLWGKNERHTTILPFGHYGYDEDSDLLVTPFFLLANGSEGERTLVTLPYARHRGRTELDMITPLYWDYRDPDAGVHQKLLFPFLYSRTSPREADTVFFPFWGHFERYGISETTWITPFFQHTHDLRGWATNIHPIVYLGRDGYDSHTVVAPFFWDFVTPKSRATVGFPAYWRFSTEETVSQLVGNVYYREKKVTHGLDWELHFFPAFSYGETPNGHWWNLLYGLGGYTRRGTRVEVRTFWIPITVAE